MLGSISRRNAHEAFGYIACALVSVCLIGIALAAAPAAASNGDPYASKEAIDLNPDPNVFETEIVAEHAMFDVGNGVMARGMTYNGIVPGPRIEVEAGTEVIVHFYNEMDHPSAIHWHGIELNNQSDGTAVSQNAVPPGGYFRYQFIPPRPGIFWYHPHHNPTNPTFQGQYAPFVVTEPAESALAAEGVLPDPQDTHMITLSDTTVCKEPGSNDTQTWPGHSGSPTPEHLCETRARDHHGEPRGMPFAAGDIPNIQPNRECTYSCWVNPGQIVLTNGEVASGRAGTPGSPGPVDPGHEALDVEAGQGVRLRLLAATTFRYLQLRLTDSAGNQIPLYRVGGQGGLIDEARLEGGTPDGFNTKYEPGEILLAPADRADVVFAVPADAAGVLTLWTQDYKQLGPAGVGTPSVPVMHFDVSGATADQFAISAGDQIRTHPAVDDPIEDVRPWESLDQFLDPAAFNPPKPGTTDDRVRFDTAPPNALPAIDGIAAEHDHLEGEYTEAPFEVNTRWTEVDNRLELRVTNTDGTHHPFHQHGFHFQPIAFEAENDPETVRYHFPYREFVDNIDIPPRTTLRLRFQLEDRPLLDGTTPGGATGRWLYHCHIFHHASLGMIAEFVALGDNNTLPPAITADEGFVRVEMDESAVNAGSFKDPDGDPVTLTANLGTVIDQGGGRWSWSFSGTEGHDDSQTVIITATDSNGARGQVAFELLDDVEPPVTTHSTSPASPDGESGWFTGSPVEVTLSAEDGPRGFGVDHTEYRIDGGEWVRSENTDDDDPFATELTVSEDGEHEIEYRSVDLKGNVEEIRSVTVRLDTSPPTTTHSLSPASPDGLGGAFYQSAVTVTLEADDGDGSGVARTEYRINDGQFQDYTEPFTVNENGEHTVTYRSRDVAGNLESDKTVSWTRVAADDQPPTTTHSLDPAEPDGGAGWYVSPVTVTLDADDGPTGSGVERTEYRIDGGPWQTYTEPFEVAADGEHTIGYRSIDAAGNVEPTRTAAFKIDTSAPETTAQLTPSSPGPGGTYPGDVTVSLHATDAHSGVAQTEYSLNGATYEPYTEPFTVSDEGHHTVEFRSADNAGNLEDPPGEVEFTIDRSAETGPVPTNTTPPEVTDRDGERLDEAGPNRMLVCDPGEWTLGGAYSYAWLRDEGDGLEPADNRSTNPSRYLTAEEDVGASVVCRVTRTNKNGTSQPADSQAVAILSHQPDPDQVPENTEPPEITDRDGVVLESSPPDRMLVCHEGEWTLAGPYAFTWLRDSGEGFEEVDNRSTNPKRYRTHSDDIGSTVICRVTRSNNYGTSEPADSQAVAVTMMP